MPRSRRKRFAALAASGEALPVPATVTPLMSERQWNVSTVQPTAVQDGRVENPDEVLKQFGGWEGLSFYARMLRQFPFLVGICMQSIAATNSIDRAIKPGVPGNKTSEQMAMDGRRLYERIAGRETINEHFLWGKYYGFTPVEKVWTKDSHTGLLAPTKLFDLDPWNVKFGPNNETYVLTGKQPYKGELVTEPRKFMFFRWGSRQTGYGRGMLRFAYMPTWYIQQVLRIGVQAIERFGRPIPWVRYWRNLDPAEKSALQSSLASQFKYYVMTPSDDPKTDLQFPAINITANGMAGKAEQDFCRYMEGWCYIALNLTQQTQDKTGGSRALESTRREIQMDQTPPASQALDRVWTEQWLDEIGEVNWPSQPRELWPRFSSDMDDSDYVDGATLAEAGRILGSLARQEMTSKVAEELLVRGGFARHKAKEMVESTIEERGTLKAPVTPPPFGAEKEETPEEESDEENDTEAA